MELVEVSILWDAEDEDTYVENRHLETYTCARRLTIRARWMNDRQTRGFETQADSKDG